MAHAFITVLTSNPAGATNMLYRHTKVLSEEWNRDRFGLLLQTDADSAGRAMSLAEYQAGRLGSGLHGAQVFESRRAAEAHIAEALA